MQTESWHWLDTGAHDAAMNMAIDEALFETANDRARPLLRTYQWTRSAVSIGYFMQYPQQFANSHEIVRRPTGGGLVFHGHDLTFTFIAPRDHEFYRLCSCDCYQRLHGFVTRALNSVGISCAMSSDVTTSQSQICFESPVRHDIVLDGRKICGGAQRRTKEGLLHQGSLLLPRSRRRPIEELREALRSHAGMTWGELPLSGSDMDRARLIRRSKYATEAWNRKHDRRRPARISSSPAE